VLPGDDGPHSQTTDKRSRAWPLRTAIDALRPSRHLQRGGRSVGPGQPAQAAGRWLGRRSEHHAAIFEWSAEGWLRRGRLGRDSLWHAGLGCTVSHEAILSSLVMDPPTVFRTEVMCQDVRRSTNPSPRWRGPPPGTPPRPSGAPSTFTDHEPENRFAQKVCDSMPGLIRWSNRENRTGPAPRPAGPDCRRDDVSVAVGLSYNRPSGGRRPLRKKRRNAEGHPGLRSPTASCDDCSE